MCLYDAWCQLLRKVDRCVTMCAQRRTINHRNMTACSYNCNFSSIALRAHTAHAAVIQMRLAHNSQVDSYANTHTALTGINKTGPQLSVHAYRCTQKMHASSSCCTGSERDVEVKDGKGIRNYEGKKWNNEGNLSITTQA